MADATSFNDRDLASGELVRPGDDRMGLAWLIRQTFLVRYRPITRGT